MEPRIIKGHMFLCKQDVKGYYRKGRIYLCDFEPAYSQKENYTPGKDDYGYITNDMMKATHAWPYLPEKNPICHDRWTDFFVDLGEKPNGLIVIPYSINDTVKWYCPDDGKNHTSKITKVETELSNTGELDVTFFTRIKFKGSLETATFTMKHIHTANHW